jgi:hypothetical protein
MGGDKECSGRFGPVAVHGDSLGEDKQGRVTNTQTYDGIRPGGYMGSALQRRV